MSSNQKKLGGAGCHAIVPAGAARVTCVQGLGAESAASAARQRMKPAQPASQPEEVAARPAALLIETRDPGDNAAGTPAPFPGSPPVVTRVPDYRRRVQASRGADRSASLGNERLDDRHLQHAESGGVSSAQF